MKWPNKKYKIGENHLCRSVFFVTQISQMTQILFSWDFYSSDDTEFIRRLTAETITHGFSRMRPVRSLQIPPESGKCPTDFTDFTDFHRFFLGCFFVTQISQMTQILFSWDFLFIGWHGIYSEISCCGDYSRIFADATCPVVADTPWYWTKRFTRDSIENLCKSVKSVGQNPPHE